jgi:hypothetical protein
MCVIPAELTMCVIPADRVETIIPLVRDRSARWPHASVRQLVAASRELTTAAPARRGARAMSGRLCYSALFLKLWKALACEDETGTSGFRVSD